MHNLCLPLGTSDKHQNYYLISFVILSYPPYPRGLSITWNSGQVFWLISCSRNLPDPDGQWRLLQSWERLLILKRYPEKYSSGTVRESHPCSLLNLTQQIPRFWLQIYKTFLKWRKGVVSFCVIFQKRAQRDGRRPPVRVSELKRCVYYTPQKRAAIWRLFFAVCMGLFGDIWWYLFITYIIWLSVF